MTEPAVITNPAASALLSPRERFLQFARRPWFPRLHFRPQDRLNPCTLGLKVDYRNGHWIVTTPVGLGMDLQEARALLASMPQALVTNLDRVEFSYRAMLVPRDSGGPGFSFGEAEQRAVRLALTGECWVGPDKSPRDGPCEPAWMGSLRVPLEGSLPGASPTPLPGDYPFYPGSFLGTYHRGGCGLEHTHHHCGNPGR